MGLFSKIDEEEVKKQHAETVDSNTSDNVEKARDIAGNAMALLGSCLTIVAGVGAAGIIASAAVAYFGINGLITLAVIGGVGILVNYLGHKTLVNNLLPV